MKTVVPHIVMVREIETHVGWYGVLVRVGTVRLEAWIAVDGLTADVPAYTVLSMAERQGFARQAVQLATDDINTYMLHGVQLVLPGFDELEEF